MRRQAAVYILLACGGALLVIALFRPDLLTGGRGISLLYAMLLLAFIGSAVWTGARMDMGQALRNAVIWLAIIVALASGYRLWQSWT